MLKKNKGDIMKLYSYQEEAIRKMKSGCILCGGVGSGKSLTAIAYYYKEMGGNLYEFQNGNYIPMDDCSLKDLYIITTARKRDTMEWDRELVPFLLSTNPDINLYSNKVVIDSWNNIKKYINVKNAFFIFDEDRVTGSGAWVKAFLKITKENHWIILSATPGDKWEDYIPVFVANGFYKTMSSFKTEHFEYSPYSPFPQVRKIHHIWKLEKLRNRILITMDFQRPTIAHHEDIYVDYDSTLYKQTIKNRWNYIDDKMIENSPSLCQALRKIVNTSNERISALIKILSEHNKVIIFYNYDYELDMFRHLAFESWFDDGPCFTLAEWNGHRHDEIPDTDAWIYLVQYNAGAEGWNCITTDTIIFYSPSYSYKMMTQAAGRIDRLNTPYIDLYYYHIKTRSGIELAIDKALKDKKTFNEDAFAKNIFK